MPCKWLNSCPLRRFEGQGRLEAKWKEEYCKSKDNWKNCKRYQMEEEGFPHKDSMLPDGSISKELE